MQPANQKRPANPSNPTQGSQQVAATPVPNRGPQREYGLGKRSVRNSPSPERTTKYQAPDSRQREVRDVDTLLDEALTYLDGQKAVLSKSDNLHVKSAATLLGKTLCMASPFNQGDANAALSIFAKDDKKAAHYTRSFHNEHTSGYSLKEKQADVMAMVQRTGNLPEGNVAKVGGVPNIYTLKYYEAIRAAQNAQKKNARNGVAEELAEDMEGVEEYDGDMEDEVDLDEDMEDVEAAEVGKGKGKENPPIPLDSRSPLPEHVREENSQGERKQSTSSKVRLYNQSLEYRVKTAQHVMDGVGELAHLNVKMYNDYPTVMVHFDADKFLKGVSGNAVERKDTAKAGFSHFLMSRYTGIVNAEAAKMGLDVPTVERSSFGHATPSIAPTDESFRINLGTMPPAYAEAHIEALLVLNKELGEFQTSLRQGTQGTDFQIFGALANSKEAGELRKTSDLMSLALTKAELGPSGKSLITHTMRTSAARNFIDEHAYHSHLAKKASTSGKGAIHDALTELFNQVKVEQDGKMSTVVTPYAYDMADTASGVDVTEHGAQELQKQYDEYLKGFSNNLTKIADMDRGLGVAKHMRTVAGTLNSDNPQIARSLDTANQLLTLYTLEKLDNGKSTEQLADVGYGSDSDMEEGGIHGRKITTHNGMRSLLQAIASKNNGKNQNLKIFYDDPYYETMDAVSKHLPRMSRKTESEKAKIIVKDINACVNNGVPSGRDNKNLAEQYPNAELWIIDPTSASTTDMHKVYKQFEVAPVAKLLVFASSGLKNEQGGADMNNYGTMRVFAKGDGAEATVREVIGGVAGSDRGLSLFAHKHRRTMQRMGLVPTNKSIVTGEVDLEVPLLKEGSSMSVDD
jgi:hypothetical protein